MKKLISALLLIVLLAQALPFNALAKVGKVLTDDELARAYALTGLGENEGQYHNGMRPNASWNAAQLIHYLEDRLSKDIYNLGDTISRADYALAELKQTDPAAYREFMKSGANESLQKLRVEAETLRQEMRYYKTHLEESAGLIAELSHVMQDDGKSMFDSEKVRYSARIEEAVRNLTADRQTVADNIDAWEAKANQLRDYLQEGPYGSDEDELYVGDILGELFKAKAPVHNTAKVTAVTASNTRLSRLAADAGLATNDVDFSIDVMTEHQVGISLCRKENNKRVPVTDVTVTVKDILKPDAAEIRGDINDLGNVLFESNKFTTDEYDCVRIQLKIDGGNKYKSILIDDLDLDLGVPFEIVMEPLDASSNGAGETANAAGAPYLVSAEFGSKDILYSNYDMVYSPVNNYDFEIKVVAANISGSPDMTMTWYENDGSFSKLKKCTAMAKHQAGNVYIFKGPWKQRFSPNANDDAHRPTFSFDGANAMKKTSRLISNRGAADQPINEGTGPNGGVFGKVLGQGMGFSTDIPLGDDQKIHLGLNLPFTEYLPKMNISLDGSITIWIGSDVLSDLVKEAKANWQSKDLKTLKRAEEKLQKKTALADYKAKMALNYNYTKVRKLKFIAQASINFGVFAVARGSWNLNSDDPDVKTKQISLTVGAGFLMNCEYSWGWQFTVGPVPVEVTFSLGLSVGFGINLQLDLCWVNNQFQNWKFQIIKEIDVSIGIYFSAQLGVGIKGFLEAYVKFTANLNVMVRLSIQDKQPSGLTVTYGCALTVGATVFFIDFNYTWNFRHGQLYPKVGANLLDHYMNAEASNATPEEAAHQDPQDYPDLAPKAKQLMTGEKNQRPDMKLITVNGHDYVFYLGTEPNGKRRVHWTDLNTGVEQSLQEAFDYYVANGPAYNGQAAWRQDYAFDVVARDGLVIIMDAHTSEFDKNGNPVRFRAERSPNIDPYISSQYLIMVVLEPDDSGKLQARFPKTTCEDPRDRGTKHYSDEVGKRYVAGGFAFYDGNWWAAYDSFTNPHIDAIEVQWDDKDKRWLRGFKVHGSMSRIDYNDGSDSSGAVFFVYNGVYVSGTVSLLTEKPVDEEARKSYDRGQIIASLRDRREISFYDLGLGICPDFIALNTPKAGTSGKAYIEMFDYAMNKAKKRAGVKLAEGDIRHIEVLPRTQLGGVEPTLVFYTQAEKNAEGDEQLRLHALEIAPTKTDGSSLELDTTRYDFDVEIPSNYFSIGYIGATPYLYWWNAVPKDGDTGKAVWRVWAMAYDPATNTVADANVMAQFELPQMKIQTGVFDFTYWDVITQSYKTEKWPIYEDVDCIPTDITLTASGTGYLVVMGEKPIKGEELPRAALYAFPEQLKPVANLQTALAQHTLVKAGSFDDIDVGVMNAGNVALASIDIEMRQVDDKGNEGPAVETVHVNLHEPEKSKVTMANGSVTLSGKEVAHRAEDFDYSPRQRDFILNRESRVNRISIGDTVQVTSSKVTASDTKHLSSDVLMPGSLADIMAAFKIPDDWSGRKKLRLRVNGVSVESNWLRTMANDAGLASNADDGNEPVLLEYVLDRERNVMVLQRPAVSNAAVDNAIESGIFANEVEAGDPVDLMVHVQDIDVDHRVYAGWDGQDWLSFSVKNHAVTGDQLKLTCAVYVDDSEEPYYLNLPYYKQATSTRRTQTFRVPLSALVDDVNLHQQARVVISAVGIEESAWVNNEFTVYLGGSDALRFTRQPEDVTAQEGEDVSFTVEVAGGVKPYTYQWQVYNPKTGKWVDLKGFTDPTMSRKDIEKKWDGCVFRCVVTDGDGNQIISREVTLRVRDRVDTGDHSDLPLYSIVAMIATILLIALRRRRKEY